MLARIFVIIGGIGLLSGLPAILTGRDTGFSILIIVFFGGMIAWGLFLMKRRGRW